MLIKKIFLIWFLLFLLPGCRSVEDDKTNYILFEQDDFTVIKTRAENIKPETIREPMCSDYIRELGYYGINAGFFNTIYKNEKPDDQNFISVSVSWSKEDAEKGLEVCGYSKRDLERIALGESPYIARGTLFLYIDEKGSYEAGVITAESCDDLKSQMKLQTDTEIETNKDYDYIYMIGGGNFYLSDYPDEEDWEKWREEKYLSEGPQVIENTKTGRSGIGIKKENDIWYVYLVSSGTNGEETPKTLRELRALFISLECSAAVYLDGAGSSQMRCMDNNGKLIEKCGDNRYIWSMIRLININE
jgi:hypothetical protein